ncbi:ataxin-2 homolog [Ceratitis capitata]|uniref:ataxin-2 homolog n=1 Tax=Ceratitis capitata TaxID=7213 RepID=UPI00032A18BF|nr:ataxin-2 homolog [Ceratitis capitata]
MVQQLHKSPQRGVLLLCCLLTLLLNRSFAAAGSISQSHKNSAPTQQQANAAQPQQQQQQQAHMTPQHLQQQPQPAAEFLNTNSHVRPQEQQQQQQLLSSIPPHLSAITTSDSSNNGMNHEYLMKDVEADEELIDPFQYMNDLKVEPRLTAGNGLPWNPYMTTNQPFSQIPAMLNNLPFTPYGVGGPLPAMVTPRLMPFFSYPQPVFIPLPMYFAPSDLYYPSVTGFGGNEIVDEPMPRAANDHRAQQSAHFQHTSAAAATTAPGTPTGRNSQIYFMRFAPMPYMFMPGLGFTTPQSTLPAIQPFSMPAISPILNIPLNFMANGKPTNIYQMGGMPNDFQSSVQFNNVNPFGIRAPTTAFASAGAHRPLASNLANSYSTHGPYGTTTSHQSSLQALQQDSKMTLLKRPYLFNGRPEEIYTLPNNFNPLYTNAAYF